MMIDKTEFCLDNAVNLSHIYFKIKPVTPTYLLQHKENPYLHHLYSSIKQV